jgi:N-acetylglutamate synthase-like GNAT family acetyltransferase
LEGSTPSVYLPHIRKGRIARLLTNEMVGNLKKLGVDAIYTMANWLDWNLLKFFDSFGFQRGALINLQLKV